MNILHVVDAGPEELQEHVLAMTSGLAVRNCTPIVAGPIERPFREALSRNSVRWVKFIHSPEATRQEFNDSVIALQRLINTIKPAILHVHGLQMMNLVTNAIHKADIKPVTVLSLYSLPVFTHLPVLQAWLAKRRIQHLLHQAKAIIVTSASEQTQLQQFFPSLATTHKIRRIPPGVEARRQSSVFDMGLKRQRVGLHSDAAVIVVVTPMTATSAVPDFLQSAALVAQKIPSVEYALIGDGPQLEAMKMLAHELRLSGCTVFFGSRPDTLEIMSTANVLVAIDDSAWGITTALQGLSRELRAVVADVPGLREVFEQVPSVPLVSIKDHEAFAQAIEQQLEGMTVEEFSIEATTGMAWGVSEVLASQDEFDLDKPGLDPHLRGQEQSQIDALLEQYSSEKMLKHLVRLYRELVTRTQDSCETC